MSNKMVTVREPQRVCDLCGNPVDVYGHRDWSALNVGHPRSGETLPLNKRAFRFFRKPYLNKTSGAPENDYRSWEWDFHGECLVDALTPLIKGENK